MFSGDGRDAGRARRVGDQRFAHIDCRRCIARGSVAVHPRLVETEKAFRSFLEHLPDALDLISRALAAGHAFSEALQMVSAEMPEPIASEFRKTYEEQNLGLSLKLALENLIQRIPLLRPAHVLLPPPREKKKKISRATLMKVQGFVLRRLCEIHRRSVPASPRKPSAEIRRIHDQHCARLINSSASGRCSEN